MTKKKKHGHQPRPLSPEAFIKQNMRSLEIGKCYIAPNLEENGLGNVVVTRKHKNDRLSVGFYLVDNHCLGVKDSYYILRMAPYQLEECLEKLGTPEPLVECEYVEAHNRIYGAIAFAEEAGIEPCKEFGLTQYFLEEDTDDVPLIEYGFGEDGIHALYANSNLEASKYLPTMKEHLGDNFKYYVMTEEETPDDDQYDDDDWDDDEMDDLFDSDDLEGIEEEFENNFAEEFGTTLQEFYSYTPPAYPTKFEPANQWVIDALLALDESNVLPKEMRERMQNLPKEELRDDLEKFIIAFLGMFNLSMDGGVPLFTSALTNAILLLGEVGNDTTSLDTLLEVMRQGPAFQIFYFGYNPVAIILPTLYKLGNRQLDKLANFVKEDHLLFHFQVIPLELGPQILSRQSERKEEVMAWYKDIMQYMIDAGPTFTRKSLMGALANIIAEELKTPELADSIRALHDADMLESEKEGELDEVLAEINDDSEPPVVNEMELDVDQCFELLEDFLGSGTPLAPDNL